MKIKQELGKFNLEQIVTRRVIRRMRLYFHRKKICANTIREMRLIKSAFFNAGILRSAAKYALNSEYAPISDMRLITCQYGTSA